MGNYPRDERMLVKLTQRPMPIDGRKYYTVWTGSSDDMENERRTNGPQIKIDVSNTDTSKTCDIEFMNSSEKIYIHNGYIGWENAGWLDTITMDFMSKATPVIESSGGAYAIENHKIKYVGTGNGTHILGGTPVFVPSNSNGWWDLVNYSPVFNSSQQGAYDWYDVEVLVSRFVNQVPVYGTCYQLTELTSYDTEEIPPNYFIRVTVTNKEAKNWKFWGMLTIFREVTTP